MILRHYRSPTLHQQNIGDVQVSLLHSVRFLKEHSLAHQGQQLSMHSLVY